MKKFILLLLATALITVFWTCEEDADDPVPEVDKVFITKVEMTGIPFLDPNGDDWDLAFDPKPDVYFILSTDTAIDAADSTNWIDKYGANYSEASQGDLPLNWHLVNPFEITDWSQAFYVKAYDKDQIGESDFMGITGPFVVADIVYDKAPSTTKTSGELQVKIYWSYE